MHLSTSLVIEGVDHQHPPGLLKGSKCLRNASKSPSKPCEKPRKRLERPRNAGLEGRAEDATLVAQASAGIERLAITDAPAHEPAFPRGVDLQHLLGIQRRRLSRNPSKIQAKWIEID